MHSRMITLSVEELNEYVRRTLASDPMLRGIRLRGEISNLKRHVTGHWYFTLKDSQSAISCAMFRSAAVQVPFVPRDGQQVVLTGNVGLYAKTGSYQFYADAMEQEGLGELYLRMEALKHKLTQEGLFDPSLKKPLPLLPKGIGIVTSATGAVIHDITRVAWRRHPGMPLYLYPVAVQGEGAKEQIAHAIQVLDMLPAVDVLIVGRGGGSMEDLWAFNEELVARAIAACHKPVVSAVGHETDFTIADFVADIRAATPSAAAEIAVPQWDGLEAECRALWERLRRAGNAAIAEKASQLSELRERLAQLSPERRVASLHDRAQQLLERMHQAAKNGLMAKQHRLEQTALRLESASPNATLRRGYAMVLQQDHLVPTQAMLDRQAPFTVVFQDGNVVAKSVPKGKEETT